MILELNIMAYDISGYFITHTPDEVSIIPEFSCPKLFLEPGIFFEYLSRRNALHYLDNLRWSVFRRSFGKYVHMIFHYFHGIYLKTILLRNMLEHFFKILRYFLRKYLFTIFRNPYQMILKIIYSVFRSSDSHAVFYNSYYFLYQGLTRLTASRFHPAGKLAGIHRRFI
jgi:hypothetical protein